MFTCSKSEDRSLLSVWKIKSHNKRGDNEIGLFFWYIPRLDIFYTSTSAQSPRLNYTKKTPQNPVPKITRSGAGFFGLHDIRSRLAQYYYKIAFIPVLHNIVTTQRLSRNCKRVRIYCREHFHSVHDSRQMTVPHQVGLS